MPLLGLNSVRLTYTGHPILDEVSLQIDEGERIGLLGRNGAGKSSLLRVLEGTTEVDGGDVFRPSGVRVAGLPQDVPDAVHSTVHDYLLSVAARYPEEQGWQIETRIDQVMAEMALDGAANVDTLSAGSKRRVLLAHALVQDPDILLLDEPTNHLDIETIDHLESVLMRRRGALVFVTHDRSFLRRVATRILDLDRGVLRSYPGNYDAYLERREAELEVEANQAALFDKKLAQEEAWVRRGIRARRTRNEGRVRALLAMREERRARRDETGRVKAQLQEAERSGRIVLRTAGLGYAYDAADVAAMATKDETTAASISTSTSAGAGADAVTATPIVQGFDFTLQRGDRIGIIGPNGSGKTTLIRLLLGELTPRTGTVTHGARLEVAHFEQLHDVLDDTKSVRENLSDGRESIRVGGAEKHVVGYLRDFLFTPEQIQGPVTKLSGGERKRLQLAIVLSRPCNVLVLDEPTNDLDLETLELMEELLLEYEGTLLVVSHDREFLDNVVTSTIVFEGEAEWKEYAGGYTDWLRQANENSGGRGADARKRKSVGKSSSGARGESGDGDRVREAKSASPASSGQRRKLSYGETRELDALPERIEQLEGEKGTLVQLMGTPDFYKLRPEEVAAKTARLGALEAEIDAAYVRWEELESIRESGSRSS
ncbi:MAG: ATP-binding cassette domain-containing protein [Candidatus Eisenbacteria bacterium]